MKNTSFFLLVLVLFLAACSPGPTATPGVTDVATLLMEEEPTATSTVGVTPLITGFPKTITDALDRDVTLLTAPERIIITGRGLIMIADAAYLFPGAAEKIIGLGNAAQGAVNFISLIDPGFPEKATLTNDATAEQIAALTPDLLILKSQLAEWMGPPLEALGIPVIYVDFETPEQYVRDLAILGKVFGDEARAAEVAAFFQNKSDEISDVVKDAPKPRVLLLSYSDRDGAVAFSVPPMTWMQSRLVELAGGDPAWKDVSFGYNWSKVTLEQIAAWDADMIFIVAYTRDASEVVTTLKADPSWQALRAVQTNKLYAFAGDIYSWDQPDPRWILGLGWLAARMHPDLFPAYDPVAEAKNFYQTLYGLDAAFFEANILPTFKGDLP